MTDVERRPGSHQGGGGTDPDKSTAEDTAPGQPVPYGRNWPDTDEWLDRDGRVYFGDGPFLNLPPRRLRRALARWFQ